MMDNKHNNFKPTRQRPVMYTDWRALFHHEMMKLGMGLAFFRSPRPVHAFTRKQWEIIRRIERIRRRLDAESEVMDRTFVRELAKWVLSR